MQRKRRHGIWVILHYAFIIVYGLFYFSHSVQDKLQPQAELSAKVMTVDTDSIGSLFYFIFVLDYLN